MNFFDGNGTSIRSGNEINTLKKQVKSLQEQTDALSVAISDLEDTVAENKGESEQRDLALGENISINTNDINSLEENLENYKTSQAEVTENQITRSSEYVETPLLRAVNMQIGETDLSDVISDVATLKEDVTNINTHDEQQDKQIGELDREIKETKEGVTPTVTDGNLILPYAKMLKNGSVLSTYYPVLMAIQDTDYYPTNGDVYNAQIMTNQAITQDGVFCSNLNTNGYNLFSMVATSTLSETAITVSEFISKLNEKFEEDFGINYKNWKEVLMNIIGGLEIASFSSTQSIRDEQEKVCSGIITDISLITLGDVQNVEFNPQYPITIYFLADDKIYENANGTIRLCSDDEELSTLANVCIYKFHHEYNQFLKSSCYNNYYRNFSNSNIPWKFTYWEKD